MILSTEDHQELMKSVAEKTSAQLSLLPSVPDLNTNSSGEFDEISHDISGGLPSWSDYYALYLLFIAQ